MEHGEKIVGMKIRTKENGSPIDFTFIVFNEAKGNRKMKQEEI